MNIKSVKSNWRLSVNELGMAHQWSSKSCASAIRRPLSLPPWNMEPLNQLIMHHWHVDLSIKSFNPFFQCLFLFHFLINFKFQQNSCDQCFLPPGQERPALLMKVIKADTEEWKCSKMIYSLKTCRKGSFLKTAFNGSCIVQST